MKIKILIGHILIRKTKQFETRKKLISTQKLEKRKMWAESYVEEAGKGQSLSCRLEETLGSRGRL